MLSNIYLTRHLGVSRVKIVQILNLLKLSDEVLQALFTLGNTFTKPIVAERQLKLIVNKSSAEQKVFINQIQNAKTVTITRRKVIAS